MLCKIEDRLIEQEQRIFRIEKELLLDAMGGNSSTGTSQGQGAGGGGGVGGTTGVPGFSSTSNPFGGADESNPPAARETQSNVHLGAGAGAGGSPGDGGAHAGGGDGSQMEKRRRDR